MDHIKPALKTAGNVPHRIAVLKSLYSWLRKEKHLLSVNEDPTFQTLVVPQARPEQWKRDKVIPREHYLLAREHLAPYWGDGMDVQAGTGWHVTELVRFAKMGSMEPYRGDAEGVAGVLVCPQTKSGEPLRTAVSADVLEAGKRLLERGTFGREKYGMAVNAACKAAGIPPFIHSGEVPALRCYLGHREGGSSGLGSGLPQPQEPEHHAALLRDACRPSENPHPCLGK